MLEPSKLRPSVIPRDQGDRIGFFATIGLLSLTTVNNLVSLNAKYSEDPSQVTFLSIELVIGLFILFNVLGNMWKAISVDTSIYSLVQVYIWILQLINRGLTKYKSTKVLNFTEKVV